MPIKNIHDLEIFLSLFNDPHTQPFFLLETKEDGVHPLIRQLQKESKLPLTRQCLSIIKLLNTLAEKGLGEALKHGMKVIDKTKKQKEIEISATALIAALDFEIQRLESEKNLKENEQQLKSLKLQRTKKSKQFYSQLGENTSDNHGEDEAHNYWQNSEFNLARLMDELIAEISDPITTEIMLDPVATPDGRCYERSSIMSILLSGQRNPFTRENLVEENLRGNQIILDMIAIILSFSADPVSLCQRENPPVNPLQLAQVALVTHNLDLLAKVILRHYGVVIASVDKDGLTAWDIIKTSFFQFIDQDNSVLIEKFLESKLCACPDEIVDAEGCTLMQYALDRQAYTIAALLKKSGADLQYKITGESPRFMLHRKIVQFLSDGNLSPEELNRQQFPINVFLWGLVDVREVMDEENSTIWHLAAKNRSVSMVVFLYQTLMEMEGEVVGDILFNAIDRQERTPYQLALQVQNYPFVFGLLARTPVMPLNTLLPEKSPFREIVKNSSEERKFYNNLLLFYFDKELQLDVNWVKEILRHLIKDLGAHPDLLMNEGDTVVHKLISRIDNRADCFELIIFIFSDLGVNINLQNYRGNTPIRQLSSIPLLEDFLQRGADPYIKDNSGIHALASIVPEKVQAIQDFIARKKIILKEKVSVRHADELLAFVYLHPYLIDFEECQQWSENNCDYLLIFLANNFDVKKKYYWGNTILHGAVIHRHWTVFEKKSLYKTDFNCQNDEGFTPLYYVTKKIERVSDYKYIVLLLMLGAEITPDLLIKSDPKATEFLKIITQELSDIKKWLCSENPESILALLIKVKLAIENWMEIEVAEPKGLIRLFATKPPSIILSLSIENQEKITRAMTAYEENEDLNALKEDLSGILYFYYLLQRGYSDPREPKIAPLRQMLDELMHPPQQIQGPGPFTGILAFLSRRP